MESNLAAYTAPSRRRGVALKGRQSGAWYVDIGGRRPAKTRDLCKRAVRFRRWPNRTPANVSATAITDDASMNEAEKACRQSYFPYLGAPR
jgi:hypothetical protein